MEDGGKTFFLTGCASGIGRHLAGVLAARGERVFATDVDLAALKTRAQDDGWPSDSVRIAALDVRDPEAWKRVFGEAVDAFSGIDVAMNIAGVLFAGWVQDTLESHVNAQLDINVKGVIFGTQVAAHHMLERGDGHIVNIASIAGVAPIPGLAVYSASKYAVRGYSIAVGCELRPRGVSVTVVCPDAVDTPLVVPSRNEEAGAMLFSQKRLLTVQDIERIIVGRVLKRKPIEVVLPRGRGIMARLANLFPGVGHLCIPFYQRRGLAHQAGFGVKPR